MHHHLAVRIEVVGLSLAAAFLYALTSFLQHQSASQVESERSMRPSLLVELLRRPRWLLSNAVDGGAYLLQFLALRAGSLLVVQTLLVFGLAFTLPLAAAEQCTKPRLQDWAATAAIVAGLALFLAVTGPDVGAGEASAEGWLFVVGVVAVLMAALMVAAPSRPGRRRAAALGAACGVLYGFTAALGKACGHLLDHGLVHALASWEPYALGALGLFGVLLAQSAFQAGPLEASLPLLTIADPIVASFIGVAAFHERLAAGGWHGVAAVVALVLLLAGVASLSRSPLVVASEKQ